MSCRACRVPARLRASPKRRSTGLSTTPVIAFKGDSYRLKDRDLGRVPIATADEP